jgi:hypothetical protein
MPEIIIGFEGHKPDLNELTFDLFEAGTLREGLEKLAPGNVTIVMKLMAMRKSFTRYRSDRPRNWGQGCPSPILGLAL